MLLPFSFLLGERRSMLCFAARDVDRAYIYFYDDKDN